MYRVDIYNGNQRTSIHLPHDSGVNLMSGTINRELNLADTFNFSLAPDNPGWNKITPFSTIVKVIDLQLNTEIFIGRALDPETTMSAEGYLIKNFEAESELGYLKDSYQPFNEVHNTSPADFFRMLINTHNSQVHEEQRFEIGNINVTNSTDNVYRYLEYQNTYQSLMDKLVTRLGGYLTVRHANGKRYLDYLVNSGVETSMPIELTKNMVSLNETSKVGELITRLVPLGATKTVEGSESSAAQPKITIGSVNGGVDYLIDGDLENALGTTIYGTNEWNDVTDANNLLTKGKEWLASQRIPDTITISAVELSLINSKYERYKLGNTYTISNVALGVNTKHILSAQTIDLLSPEQSGLTFGDKELTLIEYQQELSNQQKANNQLNSILNGYQKKVAELQNNLTSSNNLTEQQLNDLKNRISELENLIDQGKEYLDGKIIDVSEFQGDIDWEAVKNDGVVFAIIRVQYGGSYEDTKYKQNIVGAQSVGIRYAVYGYGLYANEAEAKEEAELLFNRSNTAAGSGVKPIFYAIDLEDDTLTNVRSNTLAWNQAMTDLDVGSKYQVAYIANQLYDQFNVDVSQFGSICIPSYGSEPLHPYDLWQYTSEGIVAGITANTVDMSQGASDTFKNNYLLKE